MKLNKIDARNEGYTNRYLKNIQTYSAIIRENIADTVKYLTGGSEKRWTKNVRIMANELDVSVFVLFYQTSSNKKVEYKPSIDLILKVASYSNIPIPLFFQKSGVANALGMKERTSFKDEDGIKYVKTSGIKNRIKQILFYSDGGIAKIKYPNGKIVEREAGTSVELILNGDKKYFIDIYRGGINNDVFFINNISKSDTILYATHTVNRDSLPYTVIDVENVSSILMLSMFREHTLKIKYYNSPKINTITLLPAQKMSDEMP